MNMRLGLIAVLLFAVPACNHPPADDHGDVANTDSCAITRPVFTPATTAERSIFAYDTSAPLDLVQGAVESNVNGIELRPISFASPGGGRATGYLWVPVSLSSLRPGLILMHGMPGRASEMARDGQFFAERGAVVIAIDAPHARRGGDPIWFDERDAAEQVQLIQDLQRAVDVLRAQPNVDRARIAYRGISYGGAMGALLAGVERRVKTYILMVGDGGLVSHFTGPDDNPALFEQVGCEARREWVQAMTPIEPIRYVGLAAPASLYLQSGRQDALVPVADAKALHAAASQPKTVQWYEAGHMLGQQAVENQVGWLKREVGFALR